MRFLQPLHLSTAKLPITKDESRAAGEEASKEMRGEDRTEDAEEWTNKALVRCKYNVHGMIDPFFFV